MWLLVGLGNRGSSYQNTRHNAGALVVEEIGVRFGCSWEKFSTGGKKSLFFSNKTVALLTRVSLGQQAVTMIIPQTFMNNCGSAVAQVVRFYKIPPAKLVVVHDDLDVARGKVKLKTGGGAGGHNGIRSLISDLGTQDFLRIKVGIGKPPSLVSSSMDRSNLVRSWVLSCFDSSELTQIKTKGVDEGLLRLEQILLRSKGEAS